MTINPLVSSCGFGIGAITPENSGSQGTAKADGSKASPYQPPSLEETFNSSSNDQVSIIVQNGDKAKLAALKAQLAAGKTQAPQTEDLPIINGFSVQVPQNDAEAFRALVAARDSGSAVTVDTLKDFGAFDSDVEKLSGMINAASKESNVMFGVDKLHEQGITGKGTCICVLDSGIAPHPDLKDRIIAFKDCVNGRKEPYDDNGHGTHCAGIAAGDGTSSGGKNVGVAPEANIVGVKVLDEFGNGTCSDIIRGIQWAVTHQHKYGIDVLTISLGHSIDRTRFLDPLTLAVQAASHLGLTVTVSAGNDGPAPSTVCAPGNAPSAITVGALNDNGTDDPTDDYPAMFSSRGPTPIDHLEKPDIMAPGVDIISCSNQDDGYVKMSGTSMSTPFAAGVAALMKQVCPKISSKHIKQVMMENTDPDSWKPYGNKENGAGVLSPQRVIDVVSREAAMRKVAKNS